MVGKWRAPNVWIWKWGWPQYVWIMWMWTIFNPLECKVKSGKCWPLIVWSVYELCWLQFVVCWVVPGPLSTSQCPAPAPAHSSIQLNRICFAPSVQPPPSVHTHHTHLISLRPIGQNTKLKFHPPSDVNTGHSGHTLPIVPHNHGGGTQTYVKQFIRAVVVRVQNPD